MKCNNCGNTKASRWHCKWIDGNMSESCNLCVDLNHLARPDVYFRKPYLDPNLAKPYSRLEKDGVWVTSKSHKARLMKEQGLRELGDTARGGRIFDKHSARQMKNAGYTEPY